MNPIVALSGNPSGNLALPAQTPRRGGADAALRVENRLLSGCADITPAWADLAGRALEPNVFFEPAFALAAAQHLVAFRDIGVMLVWQGDVAEPHGRLLGFIPHQTRGRLSGHEALIGLSDRRVLHGAPLLDKALAPHVLDIVLGTTGTNPKRAFGLKAIDRQGAVLDLLLEAASRHSLIPTLSAMPAAHPAASDDGMASAREALSRQGKLTLAEARTPAEIRDAIEIILAMDASGDSGRAGAAMLQNTREAGFLRAMTRGLTRTGQCRVGLLTCGEQTVAGAIVLKSAGRGWLYAAAQNDVYAPFQPQRVLLAMMQKATPRTPILDGGGLCAGGAQDFVLCDLTLLPLTAARPASLATRARDAFRRAGFRLARAGAGG